MLLPGLTSLRERAAARWLAKMGNESAAFDRAAFERWRSRSVANAKAFEEAAATWRLPLPVELVIARAARPTAVRTAWPRVAAAAAAGIIVVAGIAVLEDRGARHPRNGQVVAASELDGGATDPSAFRLSDGSIVTIGPASHLRVEFTTTERRLTLTEGRARFDVAHEPRRPFRVFAGTSVVTAHGTLFDVRMDIGGVTVSLVRGSVDVARSGGPGQSETKTLKPGQSVRVPRAGPVSQGAESTAPVMLDFDRTPISQAVATFNSHNTRKIVLGDELLGAETITGGFRADDPEGFARMLVTMFGLRIDASTPSRLLLTAGSKAS